MPALQYIQDLFDAFGSSPPCDLPGAERCVKAARRMPLTHGLKCGGGRTEFLARGDAELLSRTQRRAEPSPAQQFAGTGDAVCFWVGPLRIPDREAALVFCADVEAEVPGATATPWDSGGLYRRSALHLAEKERAELVRRRTMPAPGYRGTALAATIFLRHRTPDRYLSADVACAVDPDRVCESADLSSVTFEARIPQRVRVKTRNLKYAVARRDAVDSGLHELRSWCEEWHVAFDLVDARTRHRTVIDAVLGHFKGAVS